MGDGYSSWRDEQQEQEAKEKWAKHEAWKRGMVWLGARERIETPTLDQTIKAPEIDEAARRSLRDFMERLMKDRNSEIYKLRCQADELNKVLTDPFGVKR